MYILVWNDTENKNLGSTPKGAVSYFSLFISTFDLFLKIRETYQQNYVYHYFFKTNSFIKCHLHALIKQSMSSRKKKEEKVSSDNLF